MIIYEKVLKIKLIPMKRSLNSKLTLWKSRKDHLPLVLQGARQVGKTWILKDFAVQNYPYYHYFNFEEDPELAHCF